jgi:hypothetical protein
MALNEPLFVLKMPPAIARATKPAASALVARPDNAGRIKSALKERVLLSLS